MRPRLIVLVLLAVVSASGSIAMAAEPEQPAVLKRGEQVFQSHCAGCHGDRAQGASLGPLQVPALNGTGHSAHHGLDDMLEQVAQGGAGRGGRMPPFGELLSESDRRAAIAYVQSLWPTNVYRDWQRRHPAG
jgi:mono/diheme cytochrome c family protein